MYNTANLLNTPSQRPGGDSGMSSMLLNYFLMANTGSAAPAAGSMDPSYSVPASEGAPTGTYWNQQTNMYEAPSAANMPIMSSISPAAQQSWGLSPTVQQQVAASGHRSDSAY